MNERAVYADRMGADDVSQLVKVADDSVLFTGFVGDDVVVVHFERGILGYLPDIVNEFHEYMLQHDVDFVALP